MPFEGRHLERRAQPAELPEWMDEPCSYEEFRDCLVDLAKVNRVTLAQQPTLRWLDSLVAKGGNGRPLRILDVGCGGGDMLRSIAAWAKRRHVTVELTGIDLNPHATRAAREMTAKNLVIEWITGDVYEYSPVGGIDVVISSLMTHHMPDAEIVRFMTWMELVTTRGWFVNDLHRRWIYVELFDGLAKVAHWHRFVKHDGPVSIRRSFRDEDWCRMGAAAGINLDLLRIERCFPGRLCVGRLK